MGNRIIGHFPHFPPYPGWVEGAPVIPQEYWDVYSSEQRIKAVCEWLEKIVDFLNGVDIPQTNQLLREVEALQAEFERFKESGFVDYYAEQIRDWINENVPYLFETFAKMVFFGLTDDGYFCAYVPESWSDIEFDTGATFGQYDYGRLILRYNVDGSGVIDNTGRYDDASVRALRERIEHMEHTLYTRLGIGGE